MNADSGTRQLHYRQRTARLAAMLVLIALAVLAGGATPAWAGKLEDLRRAGTVGERFDGFVAIRDAAAAAEVKTTVDEINAKRREIYQKRAAEQKVEVDQVGRVYAKTIFEDAPVGTWFLDEDKSWKQKK